MQESSEGQKKDQSRDTRFFVHFFGPDGAGKTTHVHILAAELRKRGIKTRTIWMRSPHTLAFLALRILDHAGLVIKIGDENNGRSRVPLISRSRRWQSFWIALEFVSIIPLCLTRIWLPRRLGYSLVAERCLVDSVVTISYFIGDASFVDRPLAQLLLALLPKETKYIFIDADLAAIHLRRGRDSESIDFLEFQRTQYAALAGKLGASYLFTPTSSVEETKRTIQEIVLG